METPAPLTATELAAERTDLATFRSVLAADRSMMAWIRTALSMISFGFTIYKVLEGLQVDGVDRGRDDAPRLVGMMLTGLGTISMVLGTIEYYFRLKELNRLQPITIWRPTRIFSYPEFIIAVIMSALGVFLFASIVARSL